MKRYAYRRSVEALCIAALLLSPACSKPTDEAAGEALPLSDQEISFHLAESEPMTQSRASLFENGADLTDESKGGGNLTLYAHIDGTDKTYISGARAWYFNEANKWVFLNSSEDVMKYYWPNSDALNFFAYMPYKGDSRETYVTIGSYTEADGQTFSCNLPAEVSYNDTPEFIYAYTEGLSKQSGPVELKFKHPFAAINFKVAKGSSRMTIESISFEREVESEVEGKGIIYLTGTFSTAQSAWTPTGSRQVFTTKINKRIPNDANYNTLLDEDNFFLVMPQELKGVILRLVARRTDNETTPSINVTAKLTDGQWVAGNKYVYTIGVGDNQSEIYFNVTVEEQGGENDEWTLGGENKIDVE